MFRVPISGVFYGKHISQALFATDRVLKLNTSVMIKRSIANTDRGCTKFH